MKYLVCLIGCVQVFTSAQNLLQNPGFENWTGSVPTYWNRDDGIRLYRENYVVHGDNFSVRESLFTQTQSDADLYQTVAIHPNTYYQLSVWIWDGDSSGRIGIGIDWLPSGSEWSNIFSVDSAGWQQLTFTAEPSPPDAESASVVIRAYDSPTTWDGDAILYLDDVYFSEVPMQPPVIVRIWHIPVNPASGVTESIYAQVNDDGSIAGDTLYYGVNNLSNPVKLSHVSMSNDTFTFHIPGQNNGDTIFYFIRCVDDDGLETISDTHVYYVGKLNIIINEIVYDTEGTDEGCFIELFGPGGSSLDNFSIVGVNGNNGSEYTTIGLSAHSIPGDGFFVIAQDTSVHSHDIITEEVDLQNGPDNVELRFHNIAVDAVGYGEDGSWVFTGEWLPAPDVSEDHSLGRYPDGYDSDNNLNDFNDYVSCTPGRPNPVIGVYTDTLLSRELPFMTNPVRSGITFSSLLMNKDFYPIIIYNTLGQIVTHVPEPDYVLDLPCGLYFLVMNNHGRTCAKIVIVE